MNTNINNHNNLNNRNIKINIKIKKIKTSYPLQTTKTFPILALPEKQLPKLQEKHVNKLKKNNKRIRKNYISYG